MSLSALEFKMEVKGFIYFMCAPSFLHFSDFLMHIVLQEWPWLQETKEP